MLWVTGHFGSFSINDFYQKATGVRTIIRTNRPFNLFGQKNPLEKMSC
jgi:hypothetical protein